MIYRNKLFWTSNNSVAGTLRISLCSVTHLLLYEKLDELTSKSRTNNKKWELTKFSWLPLPGLDYHDYHHHNSYMEIPLTEHHTFDWVNCISFWQCSEILPDFLLKEFSSSKSHFFLYPVKNEICAPNFLRNHPFSTYAKFPKKNIQSATKVRFSEI